MTRSHGFVFELSLIFCAILLPGPGVRAQEREEPGRAIGKASIADNLILLQLDEGALGRENLFNLARHTLRFTPGRGATASRAYRCSGTRT